MQEVKIKHVAVDIDKKIYAETKEYAKSHGYKIKEFVELALKNEIKRRKEEYRFWD